MLFFVFFFIITYLEKDLSHPTCNPKNTDNLMAHLIYRNNFFLLTLNNHCNKYP